MIALSPAARFVGRYADRSRPRHRRIPKHRSFESVLLVISDCLTEAVGKEHQGKPEEARLLLRRAEIYAVLSGYDELVRLVRVWRQERIGEQPHE